MHECQAARLADREAKRHEKHRRDGLRPLHETGDARGCRRCNEGSRDSTRCRPRATASEAQDRPGSDRGRQRDPDITEIGAAGASRAQRGEGEGDGCEQESEQCQLCFLSRSVRRTPQGNRQHSHRRARIVGRRRKGRWFVLQGYRFWHTRLTASACAVGKPTPVIRSIRILT